MKNFAIILTMIISSLFLINCSASSEQKETPQALTVSNTNANINAQNLANTAVRSDDKDADDVRPNAPSNVSNANSSVKKDADDLNGKDSDDIRKSNTNSANVTKKDKDDLNKKRDADDRGKRDSDRDGDDY